MEARTGPLPTVPCAISVRACSWSSGASGFASEQPTDEQLAYARELIEAMRRLLILTVLAGTLKPATS